LVTEIEGLNIDGNLYNVTFGTTDDTTFANGAAQDAGNDIAAALGNVAISSSFSNGEQYYCVDAGGSVCFVYQFSNAPIGSTWTLAFPDTSQDFTLRATFDPSFRWAEFSPAVATPEPSSLMLILPGMGLLGLIVVRRKRKALGATLIG
jgi:hypothetical protein